jgi:uncharacterized membrane protein (Fun14 family)
MTQRSSGQSLTAPSPNSAGKDLQAREGHDEGFVFVDWVRNNALTNPTGLPARFLSNLSEAPMAVRVCAGLVPGLLSGFIVMKVGKMVALGLGGGILVFLAAHHLGYVTINWDRVQNSVAQDQQGAIAQRTFFSIVFERVRSTARSHPALVGGFVSGFFIGLAFG